MQCGKWLKNVGANASFPNCEPWDDWPSWTPEMKDGIKKFVMASMDAMHMPGYFFWTWKVGPLLSCRYPPSNQPTWYI